LSRGFGEKEGGGETFLKKSFSPVPPLQKTYEKGDGNEV
jgi:hypothetical protein